MFAGMNISGLGVPKREKVERALQRISVNGVDITDTILKGGESLTLAGAELTEDVWIISMPLKGLAALQKAIRGITTQFLQMATLYSQAGFALWMLGSGIIWFYDHPVDAEGEEQECPADYAARVATKAWKGLTFENLKEAPGILAHLPMRTYEKARVKLPQLYAQWTAPSENEGPKLSIREQIGIYATWENAEFAAGTIATIAGTTLLITALVGVELGTGNWWLVVIQTSMAGTATIILFGRVMADRKADNKAVSVSIKFVALMRDIFLPKALFAKYLLSAGGAGAKIYKKMYPTSKEG